MDDFIGGLLAKLNQRHDDVQQPVVNGQCQDWAAYQRMTGQLMGLREAVAIVRQVWATYCKEGDDDGS